MHDVGWVRSFMVGFFIVFGAWVLGKRQSLGVAASVFGSPALGEHERTRLRIALCRRQEREALPSSVMAGSIGGTSLAMAAIGALTPASVTMLYAALTVVLATVITVAYARFRRSESRRVASLTVRHSESVVAWYAWPIVTVAAVLPLLWLDRVAIASIAVATAGVAIALLARRVATMPALLIGDDVSIESFVDDRLRTARTAYLLAVTVAPGYVFEAFNGFTDSTAHLVALLFGLFALAVTMWLQFSTARRRPSPVQVAEWSHGAV